MTLAELAKTLKLECLTPKLAAEAERDIGYGYVSDLLSDVLAHAPEGGVLVTIQAHLNMVAVALHAGLAGVILAGGRRPDADVIERASVEGVPLWLANEPAFDLVGRLYELGIRGRRA